MPDQGSRGADGAVVPDELLAWWASGSLAPHETEAVAEWLRAHPEAERDVTTWSAVRAAVVAQPAVEPPRDAVSRAVATIRAESRGLVTGRLPRLAWVFAGIAALVGALVLGLAFRPQTVVRWSAASSGHVGFRVYRSPVGSDSFELVRQVAADESTEDAVTVDSPLLPRQYAYRVEAVVGHDVLGDAIAVSSTDRSTVLSYLITLLGGAVASFSLPLLAYGLLRPTPVSRHHASAA